MCILYKYVYTYVYAQIHDDEIKWVTTHKDIRHIKLIRTVDMGNRQNRIQGQKQ